MSAALNRSKSPVDLASLIKTLPQSVSIKRAKTPTLRKSVNMLRMSRPRSMVTQQLSTRNSFLMNSRYRNNSHLKLDSQMNVIVEEESNQNSPIGSTERWQIC